MDRGKSRAEAEGCCFVVCPIIFLKLAARLNIFISASMQDVRYCPIVLRIGRTSFVTAPFQPLCISAEPPEGIETCRLA
jgi:hypothetical protein